MANSQLLLHWHIMISNKLRNTRGITEARNGKNVVLEVFRIEGGAIEPKISHHARGDAPSDTVNGGGLDHGDVMQVTPVSASMRGQGNSCGGSSMAPLKAWRTNCDC